MGPERTTAEGAVAAGAHYYAVDGLRFLAALSVAVFHIFFYGWANPDSTTGRISGGLGQFEPLAPFTWFGWVGVEVFFVISGLVIANSAAKASAGEFATSRALRLYPAIWICAPLTLAALVFIAHTPLVDTLPRFINSVLLLPVQDRFVDGVYWTLRVEIFFYFLVFALLLVSRFSQILVLAWALTLGSALYLSCAWAITAGVVDHIPGWWRLKQIWLLCALLRCGCFFALGIWMWLALQNRLAGWQRLALALTVLCGCAEVALRTREMAGEVPDFVARPWLVPVAYWLMAIAAMYFASRAALRPAGPSALVLKRMGAMTYPLYLVHNVAGAGLMAVLIRLGARAWLAGLTAILSAVLVSYLVSTFWEPFVRGRARKAIGAFAGFAERQIPVVRRP